ncbi:hypothetical protein RJD39_04740 [Vibrio scophthalmi]|uniref:hypothetical protein n=1 Tax=Vibrio scophthalmi TaxID=45658 RepID=UPI003873B574
MKFNQSSTWRGLVLIASAAAAFLGYGDLFNASISGDGVQLGGVIGQAVAIGTPLAIGVYDAVRDEVKGNKYERNADLPQ